MAVTKDDVVSFIDGMSVLEMSEFVKELEEKYGVTAAAPTMMADTIAALLSSRPLEMMIRSVTAINVIPESGDQLVRPMASDKMTPAIHIHKVPTTAMSMPRPIPIFSVERIAITISRMAAPPIPI